MKRGQKGAIEQQLAAALEKLEMEDASGDELKKANLNLRRALQKVSPILSLHSSPTDHALRPCLLVKPPHLSKGLTRSRLSCVVGAFIMVPFLFAMDDLIIATLCTFPSSISDPERQVF